MAGTVPTLRQDPSPRTASPRDTAGCAATRTVICSGIAPLDRNPRGMISEF